MIRKEDTMQPFANLRKRVKRNVIKEDRPMLKAEDKEEVLYVRPDPVQITQETLMDALHLTPKDMEKEDGEESK
jgi:hypothetical protein